MAIPGPTLLFTSDSGAQFSPKLEGGVCSLETGVTTTNTPPHNHRHHHHDQNQLTLSPLSAASDVDEEEDEHEGDTSDSLQQTPRSEMMRHSHIHAQGLSNHLDGGALAAETLTDMSPSPGPPPAPPEYDSAQGPASRRQLTPSQIVSTSGINLRENALATPLIPVAVEFEDGLIPDEVVGAITPADSTTEQTHAGPDFGVDHHPRHPGSAQASPASTIIDTWSPLSPGIPVDQGPSAASIALPEEDVVFQGGLQVGECKEDGVLYIWQNQRSRDFRVQWRTGSGRETMWMRSSTAQIVPVYAQNHSNPLRIYLRDTNGTQTPTFEFSSPHDLFGLQTSLTGERVVLDVSCARWIRVNRPKGDDSAETYTGVRVQIWHETRKSSKTPNGGTNTVSTTTIRRRMSSESRLSIASQTTDGLSGPRRDWMVPQQSRLVVFLGEPGGFLTLPITEDVEMEDKGDILVSLKARRYGGLRRRRSQPGVRARIVSPADQWGLPFLDESVDNKEKKYSYYKTIDIEFETERSKREFVSVWSEVVEFRRKQRARIEEIQEKMGKETFTGKQAIRQLF